MMGNAQIDSRIPVPISLFCIHWMMAGTCCMERTSNSLKSRELYDEEAAFTPRHDITTPRLCVNGSRVLIHPRLSKAGWREAPGRLVRSRSDVIDVREALRLDK